MANYLIVVGNGNADVIGKKINKNSLQEPLATFAVPQGDSAPKFGSFDNLIKLTDDLAKYDSATEGTLRRIERQQLELEEQKPAEKAEFLVNKETVSAYVKKGWTWDEKKYPQGRTLQANLETLLEQVGRIDEQLRNKGQNHSEIKASKTGCARRDNVTFPTRELIDLLVPGVVQQSDFVETAHLTTVVVILARGQEKDFENWYEQPKFVSKKTIFEEKVGKDGKTEKVSKEVEHIEEITPPMTVIPSSAKQFTSFPEILADKDGKSDKDGNTVWRVVLFKSCKDKFVSLARQNKFIVRDFTFDESKVVQLAKLRKDLEEQGDKSHSTLREFSQAAWSDVFVAWMHVKAMRAYVESTLRYGTPAGFAGFILCPKAGNQVALRKNLLDALSGGGAGAVVDAADADGEEYFPYVSLNFAPRTAATN